MPVKRYVGLPLEVYKGGLRLLLRRKMSTRSIACTTRKFGMIVFDGKPGLLAGLRFVTYASDSEA